MCALIANAPTLCKRALSLWLLNLSKHRNAHKCSMSLSKRTERNNAKKPNGGFDRLNHHKLAHTMFGTFPCLFVNLFDYIGSAFRQNTLISSARNSINVIRPCCSWQCRITQSFKSGLVTIVEGLYPIPFRTRKSSPPTPMILHSTVRESRSPPDLFFIFSVGLSLLENILLYSINHNKIFKNYAVLERSTSKH